MNTYKEAWEELKQRLERDRDNDGAMMSMAESTWISAHAKHTLDEMAELEKLLDE